MFWSQILDWPLLAGSQIEEQQSKQQYQSLIFKQSICICIRYFIQVSLVNCNYEISRAWLLHLITWLLHLIKQCKDIAYNNHPQKSQNKELFPCDLKEMTGDASTARVAQERSQVKKARLWRKFWYWKETMFCSCQLQVRPVTDGINWKNGNECKKPFAIIGINGN